MFADFAADQIPGLLVFQVVILLIVISNRFILRRARRYAPPEQFPFVSILVPARDEAENIGRCARSLLAQDYPAFEVLVLDDHSSDATPAILQEIAASDARLRVLSSQPLPVGWSGKNWACAQLAEQAKGEFLLFTDADTDHHPRALISLVSAMLGEQADLLTGFPCQEMRTWGERLIVPFFLWAFFCFTPLALAYRLRLPFLSSGVGQLLMFRRAAYRAAGGHGAVRGQIAEDLAIVRRAKTAGLRWRVARLHDLISSRMYAGGRQAFDGFSKNYFAGFDFRLLPYLFVYGWLAFVFWLPLALLALYLLGQAPQVQPALPAASAALSLLLWIIPYHESGIDPRLALLYPVTILITEVIALNSLRLSLAGQLTWKSREISRPRWKWL